MDLLSDKIEMCVPCLNKDMQYIETLIKSKSDYINKTIIMEECSELIKEVSKSIRDCKNKNELTEEMVDVIISLQMLMKMEHITQDEINREYNKKMKRNLLRINNTKRIENIKQSSLFSIK